MTKVIDINEIDIENVTDKLLQAVLICLSTDAEAEDGEMPAYAQRQPAAGGAMMWKLSLKANRPNSAGALSCGCYHAPK